MTGFDNGNNGMSYPVLEGVIVLDKDVQKVKDLCAEMEKERIKKEIKKKKNEARHIWKLLIKRVCVKRYTARL
eukprot:CAMPEP_0205800530 /NCGR_PEP_ID=MMETSP0205-20121125/2201_1 /ASSEMBLY_ACC=CAM_ASM_000278 /TAXON_ID=36767 /ORGANISM="Euplotes focardii, Strain TN1" /LENGTH=72 /DNA_ID=CAMNT_0053063735 /DNA_START=525 /DNA_END=740 /DNA_ORIENTATION=+